MAARRAAYQEEPYSDDQIQFYVRAWRALATERPIGMDVGPVPDSAIYAWADRYGLDHEAADLVEHVVRHLESEHAEERDAKAALEALKGPRR